MLGEPLSLQAKLKDTKIVSSKPLF